MSHNEFETISRIRKIVGRTSSKTLTGIGDDAAILKSPSKKLVATTDGMVEGVHFDLGYTTATELGHKALAMNLSDIAAMGGRPLYALVSLGLTQEIHESFVDEMYGGLVSLARKHKVDIVGGNVMQSPNFLMLDITVLGECSKPWLRSGAKVGDVLAVTGKLGTSAAGLNILKKLGRKEANELGGALIRSHLLPTPRVQEALLLEKTGAVTSAIDISDGLASEVHHLCAASAVGMLVDFESLPRDPVTQIAAERLGAQASPWVLYGGEDYELLVTIKKSLWTKAERALLKSGTLLTPIGEVRPRKEGIKLKLPTGEVTSLENRGWNHFVRRQRTR